MSSDSASESDSEHGILSQPSFGSESESDSLDNTTSRKRQKLSNDSTPREAVSSFSVNVPSRVKSKTATVQVPEAVPTPVTVAETQVAVHGHASSSFQDLNLKPWLIQSLKNMAIHRPTRIQHLTIPAILEGRDVIGSSRTGSGKTGQSKYQPLRTPQRRVFLTRSQWPSWLRFFNFGLKIRAPYMLSFSPPQGNLLYKFSNKSKP